MPPTGRTEPAGEVPATALGTAEAPVPPTPQPAAQEQAAALLRLSEGQR